MNIDIDTLQILKLEWEQKPKTEQNKKLLSFIKNKIKTKSNEKL